jgi:hypothetical protein
MSEFDCKRREARGRQCGWTDPHASSQYVVSNESSPGTCYPSKMRMYQSVCSAVINAHLYRWSDRLCGLVVRVLGYRSGGPGSIPGTTIKKSSGSGTESTQPREYN